MVLGQIPASRSSSSRSCVNTDFRSSNVLILCPSGAEAEEQQNASPSIPVPSRVAGRWYCSRVESILQQQWEAHKKKYPAHVVPPARLQSGVATTMRSEII